MWLAALGVKCLPVTKFSQETWIRKDLLYYILCTTYFMGSFGVHVHAPGYAASIFHSAVMSWSHQHNLIGLLAMGWKRLPIAILSEEIWIRKTLTVEYLQSSLFHGVSWCPCTCFWWCIVRTSFVHTWLKSSEPPHLACCSVQWRSPSCNIPWVDLHTNTKKALLYDVLSTTNFVGLLGVQVHGSADAPTILHSAVLSCGHQDDFFGSLATSTECLPVAVFSE